MIRVAIVDDEKCVRDDLSQMVARYGAENHLPLEALTCADAASLLGAAQTADLDIVLLDIEMPDMDGMQAAHALRDAGYAGQIVFVTNMAQYAIKGYEVAALDFIVKPVDYPTFAFKFARVCEAAGRRQDSFVVLETKDGFSRFKTADLIYVEVKGHKLIYHTETGDIELWGTIKGAAQTLEPRGFAFCNACYLVNLEKVTALEGEYVRLGETRLKMSRGKSRAFVDALTRSMGGGA